MFYFFKKILYFIGFYKLDLIIKHIKYFYNDYVYVLYYSKTGNWILLDKFENIYVLKDVDKKLSDGLLQNGTFCSVCFEYTKTTENIRIIESDTFQIPDKNLEWLLKTLDD